MYSTDKMTDSEEMQIQTNIVKLVATRPPTITESAIAGLVAGSTTATVFCPMYERFIYIITIKIGKLNKL